MFKKILNNCINAFEPVNDKHLFFFAFKRLVFGFIPGFILLFIASRLQWSFGRTLFSSLGYLSIYIITAFSAGAVSRYVFTGYFRKENPGFNETLVFAWEFAPAYILTPLFLMAGALILKVISVALLFIGNLPWIGEILVGLILIPMLVIGVGAALLFLAGLFLTPAIIAVDEKGISNVFKKIWQLGAKRFPGLITSISISFIFTSAIAGVIIFLLWTSAATIAPLAEFILQSRFQAVLYALQGTLFNFIPVQAGIDPGFTFHISALIIYMSAALLIPFIIIPPLVYLCSASVGSYILLTQQPDDSENKEELEKQREFKTVKCRECGAYVEADLSYCTFCGKSLPQEPSSS